MAVKMEDLNNITNERKMTICGTVDYMAPEVIEGKQGQAAYTEKADIYSLAITLWDILHPGREKYPGSGNSSHKIFEMVLDGQRPPIAAEVMQALQDLLENAWNADPVFRPSAKMVVALLESLQDEICGQIAHRLSGSISYLALQKSKKLTTQVPTFNGLELSSTLIEHGYAHEKEEALRLGNSLMDAGCMHHTKHNQPFDDTLMSTYFFDNHQLDLNQPFREKHSIIGSHSEESSSYATASLLGGDGGNLCGCRKLGQGHLKQKMPTRMNFLRRQKQENGLTVNLLNETEEDTQFGDFDTSSMNILAKKTRVLQVA